jgi:3-mercaptopyruvate sulfurtransferase SseA
MRKGLLFVALAVGLSLILLGNFFYRRFADRPALAGGGKAETERTLSSTNAESASTPDASEAKVRRITVSQLRDALRKGSAVVVDVRLGRKYAAGHIKGAIHIPSDEIVARANELPRDRLIVAYCA